MYNMEDDDCGDDDVGLETADGKTELKNDVDDDAGGGVVAAAIDACILFYFYSFNFYSQIRPNLK